MKKPVFSHPLEALHYHTSGAVERGEAEAIAGIPAYVRPIWENGKVTNMGDLPLWSGKGAPPEVGAVVRIAGRQSMHCRITGYEVEGGWLMATGERVEDGKRGNLAGAEIYWPEESR